MHKALKRIVFTGLLAATLPLGLLATTASAATTAQAAAPATASAATATPAGHTASASHISPSPGQVKPMSVNGYVWATDGLYVHSGPGTGYSHVGLLYYHTWATVGCWAVGNAIGGNPYWDWIGWGWVPDYWFYTGATINQQVGPCW